MIKASSEEKKQGSGEGSSRPDDGMSAEAHALGANAIKNFRHHPEMENFYRFVYENNLRLEALEIVDGFLKQKENRKQARELKNKKQ